MSNVRLLSWKVREEFFNIHFVIQLIQALPPPPYEPKNLYPLYVSRDQVKNYILYLYVPRDQVQLMPCIEYR